eukprot:TRINITY_DN18283_c0_g1_i1.p1 TRINITY_DN18283_c0_g1~~TRINITY_DN18283_c0_g1_i1.p1  ORF type:complete len:191 (+),score=1.22 TRINITY_DN18283_c0_g1_i1:591-1163(+)
MAVDLGMSKSTLHRRVQEKIIKRTTNAMKPLLTEANKKARLHYAISMVDPTTLDSGAPFLGNFDRVHIDEKWFYMSEESGRFYLVPREEKPYRTGKSKHFITKVLFLVAVAQPRFDPARNQWWSGKIDIFPLTFQEPVKRNSKNRPRGMMVTKPIESVTKEVTKRFLIERYSLPFGKHGRGVLESDQKFS